MTLDATWGDGPHRVVVATGAPGELGLLEALALDWSADRQVQVGWRKAGTGAALQALRAGMADVVLGHAPRAEAAALADGSARARTLVGGNEFLLVGPRADPAGVGAAPSCAAAWRRIATAGATFVSRDDGSGTHARELELWRAAGVAPDGDWYVRAPGFMRESLGVADARAAYYLVDSSTWHAGGADGTRLVVLRAGDAELLNVYHALLRADAGAQAEAFLEYLAGSRGQQLLGDFGRERWGRPLYLAASAVRDRH